MKTPRERVLLVENDPDVIDLIARQTLLALGYRVGVARAAASALQEIVHLAPDVVIANLNLPDLSGKDLMVALAAQCPDIPVIVLAQKGMESDIIHAFRLRAADYLMWPAREAEVVAAVERVLKQLRLRRERESLAQQLQQTNTDLQRRVRELTTILSVGKAVTSITQPFDLFEKIVDGGIYVTGADCGWLLLREANRKTFLLSAQRNLPETLASRLNQPWDDGISSLAALSGETFTLHGAPLARFKISQLGQAALITPVKIKKEVVGLLVVIRKEARPFTPSNKTLLEAVADYASISLGNARLFRLLEERARSLQGAAEAARAGESNKAEILNALRQDLQTPLTTAISSLDSLLISENTRLNAIQKGVLRSTLEKLQCAHSVVASLDSVR